MARLAGRNKAELKAARVVTVMTAGTVPAVVSVANAAASVAAPTKAEFDAVVALSNANKTQLNLVITLLTEIVADHNALVTAVKQ